jgi:hypothetical protein
MKRALLPIAALLALVLTGAFAVPAAAAPAPAWSISAEPVPANLPPGQVSEMFLIVTNVGAAPTDGSPFTVEETLPPGIVPLPNPDCTVTGQSIACTFTETLAPNGEAFTTQSGIRQILVNVASDATGGPSEASVQGGGAPRVAVASMLKVSASAAPFDFLSPGLRSPFTAEDGSAQTLAGAHPYQQTASFNLPTELLGGEKEFTGAGHLRRAVVSLPAGLLGDTGAASVLCTEARLLSAGCPPESQVGLFGVRNIANVFGANFSFDNALFAMVPPPGHPAELAANVAGFGFYAHLLASVRTDGDYGIDIDTPDIIALPHAPILGVQVQVWGDPSSPLHEEARFRHASVESQPTAFLTMPGSCPGQPFTTAARMESWEEPGVFHTSAYASADLEGNPVEIAGCNELPFAPTISSQPTTNLADSPTGLDFDLRQPVDMNKEDRAPAELRDATVTLPAGMVANPSQAAGLEGCSETQIGYLADDEEEGVHFSTQPNGCPDGAKLGSVQVTTPLLSERTEEGTKLATDPETGEAIPHPLNGAVYLAEPYENPFGSLLALYLAVEDPESGTVAKLAGRVVPDPQSGQLTTVFEENPQLPLEDVRLHLFGGARASLISPPTCGSHTTNTDLRPWSSPAGQDAHPTSSFQTTASPLGGACPSSEAAAPNAPSFEAGTLSPEAGAYSPFVLKLSRRDGSQRLTGIDTTLPPGLSGRLAGVAECSDAQIALAKSREAPNMGQAEVDDPACPASSEVGTVKVAAGAGPAPFWTAGHAYLAGPYKGAPLSLAAIVPAVAGPFDLGAVVTRVALRLEPETTQIHAVSDPFPTILDGIPLDLRSVSLEMGRPRFTLNPTSCDKMQITGFATAALGGSASLANSFQVGGCQALPFKPKLSLRLEGGVKRGSHPRLIADLRAKPGEANIARAQVKLPHPVFLDQAHIRTVCTRVQFAAQSCPARSVYGTVWATTPLLDYKLSGNVYLRSSSHELPDLVVDLHGPDTQPIEIALAGRTDSVKGALRNTFEAVPDQPVTQFHLELFGGKRGLVEMSSGFCASRKATVELDGQNGKVYDTTPLVEAKCPKRQTRPHNHEKRGGGHKRGSTR